VKHGPETSYFGKVVPSTPALATAREVLPARLPKSSRASHLDKDAPRTYLTDREQQILRLVCGGLTNAGIAESLSTARRTIKSEIKRIFRKIEVSNRIGTSALVVRGTPA